jgi:hypothetical protein
LEVSLVLLRSEGVHQDVINEGKAEVEPPQYFIHETLESLRGVAQAECLEWKFE